MPSITVLDSAGVTQTVQTLPSVGSALSAASLPVVIASDQALWPATQPVSIAANTPTIAAGSAIIGKVGIDQTTPGTTNAVSVTNASLAVTGTFWQSTQPVSLASLPALTTGAAVIGAVTQSGTWNVGTITTLPALATGSNVIGALTANQSVNAAQINGVTPLMGNGVTGTGSLRVTIASDNTAFNVITTPVTPTAFTLSSAATTNLTTVKASAGTLYVVAVSNNGAAAAFLKLYNLAVNPTLASSVPVLIVPIPAASVVSLNLGETGMRFGTGIALAITNLIADTDATAVAAAQVKTMLSYI